jgi:hypothetical protein
MNVQSHGGMILTGDNRELGAEPVPVSLRLPQIPHRLTRAQTEDSAVKGVIGRTVEQCVVIKYDVRAWIDFIWLTLESVRPMNLGVE